MEVNLLKGFPDLGALIFAQTCALAAALTVETTRFMEGLFCTMIRSALLLQSVSGCRGLLIGLPIRNLQLARLALVVKLLFLNPI